MLWLGKYKVGLIIAVLIMVFFKYLLEPTATLFYELHHITGVNGIYWGYSVFKVAAYYFAQWSYQNLASVAAGLLFFSVYVFIKSVRLRRASTSRASA